MDSLLPLLLLLVACPLGMGIATWLSMRTGQRGRSVAIPAAPLPASAPAADGPRSVEGPGAGQSPRLLCRDWRVLAGLAAVGALVWVVAPQLVVPLLVLLAVLACPLSHLLLMRGAAGCSCHPTGHEPTPAPRVGAAATRAERADHGA